MLTTKLKKFLIRIRFFLKYINTKKIVQFSNPHLTSEISTAITDIHRELAHGSFPRFRGTLHHRPAHTKQIHLPRHKGVVRIDAYQSKKKRGIRPWVWR